MTKVKFVQKMDKWWSDRLITNHFKCQNIPFDNEIDIRINTNSQHFKKMSNIKKNENETKDDYCKFEIKNYAKMCNITMK